MIFWVNPSSEKLQVVFDAWKTLRGTETMPHVSLFNQFSGSTAEDVTTTIVLPDGRRDLTVRRSGELVQRLFPMLRPALKLAEISPQSTKVRIASPVFKVLRARQPLSIRQNIPLDQEKLDVEMLFLPFDDKFRRIRVIEMVLDDFDQLIGPPKRPDTREDPAEAEEDPELEYI